MGTTGTVCLLLDRKDAKLKTRIYYPEQPQNHFWELYFWVSMTRERRTESATSKQQVTGFFLHHLTLHRALGSKDTIPKSKPPTASCSTRARDRLQGVTLGKANCTELFRVMVALLPSLLRGNASVGARRCCHGLKLQPGLCWAFTALSPGPHPWT